VWVTYCKIKAIVRASGRHHIIRGNVAGQTSLAMTQRYIEGDTEAKRKLVALV
jgi:hypothetical protein